MVRKIATALCKTVKHNIVPRPNRPPIKFGIWSNSQEFDTVDDDLHVIVISFYLRMYAFVYDLNSVDLLSRICTRMNEYTYSATVNLLFATVSKVVSTIKNSNPRRGYAVRLLLFGTGELLRRMSSITGLTP